MDYAAISAEALVRVCLHSPDEAAWTEFVRRFQPLIASVAIRVTAQWGEYSPAVIDDLVQETYLKLFSERERLLQRFVADHENAIYAYIKVFAANLIHDHFKALNSKRRGGSTKAQALHELPSESFADCGSMHSGEIERQIVFREVDACLRAVVGERTPNDRDRRIFWLYFRVGLSASDIAALPGIALSTKGVESTLLRLTRAIRQHLGLGTKGLRKSVKGIERTESF